MKSYDEHYSEIYTRLLNEGKNKGINYSTDPSSLVATTVREVATLAESTEYAIAAAIREGNAQTARLKSSILEDTLFFGVRLKRKAGKAIVVDIYNKNTTTSKFIKPFTEFTSESGATFYYFSETGINLGIPPQGTVSVSLFEGTPKSITSTITKTAQEIVIESDPWVVDDSNIMLTTNSGEIISCIKDPVYTLSSSPQASNLTDANGKAIVAFGAPPTSYSPAIGTIVTVNYAETEGGSFSKTISNGDILSTEDEDVQATIKNNASSGSNELSAEYYKKYGHYLAKTYNNVTDANEFKAALLEKYSTVIRDCYAYGQSAIAPLSLSYMNVITILLIEQPGVEVTETMWADMVSYLKSISSEFWYFHRIYPEKVDVILNIDIVLNNIRFPSNVDIDANIKKNLLTLVNSAKATDFRGTRVLTTYSIKECIRKTIMTYTTSDDPIFDIKLNTPASNITINLNRYFNLDINNITLSITYRM